MSTLDVVAEILREVAPRALNARQVVELAAGRLPTASRTPETVVSRDLALEVKRSGPTSRFLRTAPGEFLLKEALPTAFYNEIDPYAAAWTNNLVTAGEIAVGVVDERSIRDLKPADVASYRQCHFFAGIGGWSRALRDAGWPDDFNIWSGSCPCTDFSSAGRRRGFDGDFHLWPDWFRLIAACRPACVIGEQVSSKAGGSWLDLVFHDLEAANYTCHAIDTPACGVGAPHRRARFYFVAYARERGREIIGAPWLHDRGQPRHDTSGRSTPDIDRDTSSVSDATGARRGLPEDTRADRGDAREGTEAIEWGTSWDLELERGGADDDSCAVSDAERVMWHEGRIPRTHGRSEVEPDRHGEADGGGDNGDRSIELGDTGFARGRGNAGEVSRAEGAGEGERIEARDLAHEPLAPGADDGSADSESGMVRGAIAAAGDGFRPGDRIRIEGDSSWGGAVQGFWAVDVEWIFCRPEPGHKDGRWRPVGPGIEPLVDGAALGMGRTRAARLRGFGNAIVLPLATAFVESVIDAFVDASLDEQAKTAPLSPAAQGPLEVTAVSVVSVISVVEQPATPLSWSGPNEGETAPSGMLFGRVPGERWPHGPPSAHEPRCNLFPHRGSPGGLFCDCAADSTVHESVA